MAPPRSSPFADARKRKRKHHGHGSGKWDPSKHPRGNGGRFTEAGDNIAAAAGKAGQNVVHHADFGEVKRANEISNLTGLEVFGFRHAVSNQAIAHMQRRHAITTVDLARLPSIVKSGTLSLAAPGTNGVPRVLYRATSGGVEYEYVAEVRSGKKRLDAITLYRV